MFEGHQEIIVLKIQNATITAVIFFSGILLFKTLKQCGRESLNNQLDSTPCYKHEEAHAN